MRVVTIIAVLLALAGAQASQPAARPIVGLKASETPLLGVVWSGRDASLGRLDPATLEPAGPGLRVTGVGAWSYSPEHTALALGSSRSPAVRIVDAQQLTVVRTIKLGLGGRVERIDWLDARILTVVYEGVAGTRIAWVDPESGRLLKRARLGVDPLASASGGGRLVALLPPRKGIGAGRLAVAGANASLRVVRLPSIRIGSTAPNPRKPFRRVVPGLALDPSGLHAYVVGTNGVAADVDLRSLAVKSHAIRHPRSLAARLGAWLVPSAEAKSIAGPQLEARWLGGGLVAVAGTSYSATVQSGAETQSATPLGLRLLDVRTWTERTIDAGADGFAVADGALLAYGVRSEWSQTAHSESGMGVAAYGADGSARFRLLPSWAVDGVMVHGSRAYGWVVDAQNPWHLVVLDVAAGTVERELRLAHPTNPLLGDGSSS